MVQSTLSEELAVVGRIKSQTVTAAATAQSDVVDMRLFNKALAIINVGDWAAGSDGVLNAGIYGDTATGGSFTTLITGKALTAATFTGTDGDDSVAIIEVDAAEAEAQGFRYLRLKATPTNQNLTLGAVILGGVSRYNPASDHDLAAVKEIVR